MSRTAIFIDKFSEKMADEGDILRTYYYNCPPYQSNPPTPEESRRYAAARKFYDALRMRPRYEVRLGRLEYRGQDHNGQPIFQQKRVDILLGVDLVKLATKHVIQQAILVAGDSDFIPAIAAAKSEGVVIRLFHGSSCHDDLKREADERIAFNQEFFTDLTMI